MQCPRIYKSRFLVLLAASAALLVLVRSSIKGSGVVRVDRSAAMDGANWDKAEFAAAVTRVDNTCPVCFGTDFCKELERWDFQVNRNISYGRKRRKDGSVRETHCLLLFCSLSPLTSLFLPCCLPESLNSITRSLFN